jgi:hypothetical protein
MTILGDSVIGDSVTATRSRIEAEGQNRDCRFDRLSDRVLQVRLAARISAGQVADPKT